MSEVGTTADINEIASYTEYNVTTPTADFAVGFDYDEQTSTQKGDAIRVTINRVDPSTLGYTVTLTNKNTVNFSPSVSSGNVVRLQRETDIDSNLYTFSAGALFVATQVDADFKQIRKSQQEVRDRTNNTLDYVETTIANYDDRIETVELATAKNSQDIASEILRAKAVEKGLQNQINNTGNSNTVTPVKDITELDNLKTWDGRTVYVRNDGEYYYSDAIGDWVKDSSFMLYDFKTEQPIQAYYDVLGNWDDAIYLAQKNVIALGYSPKLRFPSGTINLNRPILGGASLGDKLHTDYPELGMKDSNGVFLKSFPTQLYGSAQPPYSTQGLAVNGTSLIFTGCKSQTDLTYMNYGVIHFAPTNPLEFANSTETKQDTWGYANLIVQDLSITTKNQDGTEFGTIHGIFMFRHHWHYISNVQIDAVYGAGILGNWVFDSNLERVVYTRCGRMSPNINDYQNDGNFSIEYQTYAPLHLMCTLTTDTTNFIKSYRGHFENNYRAVADIILSRATPIWLQEHHHESGQGLTENSKIALATNYGVQYPCQDSESGFDYKNFSKAIGSCVVIADNITGYTKNFKSACVLNQYTSLNAVNWRFNGDVSLNANNTNCTFSATDSLFNNMSLVGTFADKSLNLTNCTVSGNLDLNYFGAFDLINTKVAGAFTVNNQSSTYQSNLDRVVVGTASGDFKKCFGTVVQTSTESASSMQSSQGLLEYTNIDTILGKM